MQFSFEPYRIIFYITLMVLGIFPICSEVYATEEPITTIEFTGGDGTEASPYQITHIEHLNIIRNQLDKHYILMNDLDFSSADNYLNIANMAALTTGEGWVPIGSKTKKFGGNFNGNGHVIKGLRINRNADYQGLFGYTSSESIIINGRLENASIKGGLYTGVLVGSNSGNIIHFSVEGEVNGSSFVGGLVGENKGNIIAASMVGNVNAVNNHVGGLAGYTDGGSIDSSYSLVNVKGKGSVGGLVGNQTSSITTNSYAIGSVSVEREFNYAGGLVGLLFKGQIRNCYAVGQLQGFGNVGGLVGYCNSGAVISSYYDSTLSGYYDTGKGIPKTTAEMKSADTFAEWEFKGDAVWNIVNTATHYSYPYLIDNTLHSYPGYAIREPKLITSFEFSQFTPSVSGVIDQETNTIKVSVPYGTDLTNLVPTIAYEGKEIFPDPEIPQDFTDSFEYTVIAQDESSQTYTVTVSIEERAPVIVSIKMPDNITVDCGTSAEQAITELPEMTTITDSNGDLHSVFLEWVLIDYDGNIPGNYRAEGTFVLPVGIHQSDPPISLKVAVMIKVEPSSIIPPANMPPSWPDDSLLTAGYINKNEAQLNWTAAIDDKEITGYRIYKEGLLIGEVSGNVHTYWVTGLSPSTNYLFQVQARDKEGFWTNNGPCLNLRTAPSSDSGTRKASGWIKKASAAQARVNYDNETYYIQTEHDENNDEIIVTIEYSLLNKLMEQSVADRNQDGIMVEIPSAIEAGTYTLQLPGHSLTGAEHLVNINFITPIATLIIPDNMLSDDVYDAAQELAISISKPASSHQFNELVRNMPNWFSVIELSTSVNKHPKDWCNISGPVVITLPHFIQSNQVTDSEYFSVYYLDKNYELSSIPNALNHTDSKSLTFKCIRSGVYVGTYTYKRFKDLADYGWAKKPIEVLASKGIITGTSSEYFSPGDKIRRADYLILLLKTLGITVEFENNFSDAHKGDYYYDALGMAKELKVASGINFNQFRPLDYISRQDMIVLAVRALASDKKLTEFSSDREILNRYFDRGSIDPYAYESMEIMVSEGIVRGYENMLNPQKAASRAEAAVFLYKIHNKYGQ